MVKKSKLSLALCTVMTVCALSLTGCGTLEPTAQANDSQAFGHLSKTAEEYADLADKSTDDGRFNALIMLARAQISTGDAEGALKTASELHSSAKNSIQNSQATIIDGLIQSLSGNSKAAASTLAKVNGTVLNENAARYYYLLNFKTNERLFVKTKQAKYFNQAFNSARNLVPLTQGNDRATICRRTVDLLESAGNKELSSRASRSADSIDRGYYEYALADMSSSKDAKAKLFASFKQKYPDHPLNILISDSDAAVASTQNFQSDSPSASVDAKSGASVKAASAVSIDQGEIVPVNASGIINIADDAKVAVLLPLSGRYASAVGEPAKLGVMSALTNSGARYKVSFYDTAKQPVSAIVNTLKNDGTALIIGPLLKPEVAELNAATPNIPVIALNTPDGNRPSNEWYFDLGPDYEGALAAAKIKADGFKTPIVIYSNDKNSTRAAAGFTKAFGKAVKSCSISDPVHGDTQVKKCPVQGADVAYIVGSTSEAVSYKSGLPTELKVYLTNQSFDGFNNSGQQLALRGAKMGNMPWLLSDSELKNSLMKTVPKANATAQRIFCAAYDAISLAKLMPELAKDNKDVLHGLSGDISLGQNGLVETAPLWVDLGQIRN